MAKIPCAIVNQPLSSKINWVMGILAILGALSDPQIGNLIPDQYAGKIMMIAGVLGFILRSFFTATPVQPEDANKPAG